jgi:hypothetical protein
MFVSDNILNCTKLFETQAQKPVCAGTWFLIHNIRAVFLRMLEEALKQEHGQWQWRGFWLWGWEKDSLAFEMVRVYIAGGEPDMS